MKLKEWNNLKIGDLVTHKHYGICKVDSFVFWSDGTRDPVLMPDTEGGKKLLEYNSGLLATPFLETKKRLLSLMKSFDEILEDNKDVLNRLKFT